MSDFLASFELHSSPARSTLAATPKLGPMIASRRAPPKIHTCYLCKFPRASICAEYLRIRRDQLSLQVPRFQCLYPYYCKASYAADFLQQHTQRKSDSSNVASKGTENTIRIYETPLSPSTDEREDFLDDRHFCGLYASIFSRDLIDILSQRVPVDRLSELPLILPSLLELFAVRLGWDNPSGLRHDAMCYIYNEAMQITHDAIQTIISRKDNGEGECPRLKDETPVANTVPSEQSIEFEDCKEYGKTSLRSRLDIIKDINSFPEMPGFRHAIKSSPEYQWLINSILSQTNYVLPCAEDSRIKIRQEILSNGPINAAKTNQRPAPPKYTVVFRAPWIVKFFTTQGYSTPFHEALDDIIVLTGSANQVWATTCLQYVESLWPDFGAQILYIHMSLLSQQFGNSCEDTLPDQSRLLARTDDDGSNYTVNVTGAICSIIEVTKVLVWLNAALSSLGVSEGLSFQHPSCKVYTLPDDTLACWPVCNTMEVVPSTTASVSAGGCWASLFHNPILIKGYPIPRRPSQDPGLETSLIIMTQLANTEKISNFSGHLLIKGFSTILVPTKQEDGFIFWHTVSNEDSHHISYSDTRVKELLKEYPAGLTYNHLETSRHIIGWCSNAKNYTGSHDANYNIERSQLRRPGPGCAFDKITINCGMFVTGGISVALGKKGKATHIKSRDDYTMRLKWIAKKFVVLYDVRERRAWLVDGASALLHLVRASLKYDSNDPFKSVFLFEESAIHNAPSPYIGKAASISVLTNKENMSLPLYAKPDNSREETSTNPEGIRTKILSSTKTNYCLKDRIESICDVLEQIIAHQSDNSTQDGVGFKIRCSPRRQLEGFDFMDIATDEDPLWPRATTLRASGRGWVDFTRAINAITLFGTSFGDLIQPVQEESSVKCSRCHVNVEVPKGQDYLAVCVSELQSILEKWGSEDTSPWRLVDDIYWHSPDKTFEPCNCTAGMGTKPDDTKVDRVQVLLPAIFPRLWSRGLKSPANLRSAPHGAVVFGHSWRFPLRWDDRGAPKESDANHELEETDISSGIEKSTSANAIDSNDSGSSDAAADRLSRRLRVPLFQYKFPY
ncbi:hypothetical protein M426DRAFT_129610 [Hypoxylon sp. CI-4A]|nr:hypothetical protein M426DRAFT_129610 [Hypoxylon sp. CI-4A]